MKLQHLNKKRLIVLDLDGTVLKDNGVDIHPKTIEAINWAKKQGHLICILTGRPHRASLRFYRKLELDTLLSNFDGAHIHDPLRHKFKRILLPISEYIVKKIINEPVIVKNTSNILIEYYNKAVCAKKDEEIEKFFHLDDIEGDEYFVDDPNKWFGSSTNIVLIPSQEEAFDDIVRVLEKYSNSIKIQTGNVYGKVDSKAGQIITLTNKLANKYFTTQLLAQYYNKDLRDVIAFGDQMNDFELINNVGYGIAMKNANKDLKKVARGITFLTNEEGGVGDYLMRLLNGEEL